SATTRVRAHVKSSRPGIRGIGSFRPTGVGRSGNVVAVGSGVWWLNAAAISSVVAPAPSPASLEVSGSWKPGVVLGAGAGRWGALWGGSGLEASLANRSGDCSAFGVGGSGSGSGRLNGDVDGGVLRGSELLAVGVCRFDRFNFGCDPGSTGFSCEGRGLDF